MKNMLRLIAIYMGVLLSLSSCEKYEDVTTDYDYSAVYFATQKPLRTIVARDEMKFKFGVVLAGKRENTSGEWVKFTVDPKLLKTVEGADGFTFLPKSYYSMQLKSEGDSTLYVPKGSFLGDLPITLNREAFLSDPLTVGKKYAIPLRIYESSADSILYGNAYVPSKAYTIIVVKYILPEHAAYYGTGTEMNGSGVKTGYEITKAAPRWMKTLSANELEIAALGNTTTGAANKLKVVLASDRSSVRVEQATGGAVVQDLGSTLDRSSMTFNLKYSFERSGELFTVNETLTPRQEAEKELRFEEW